MHAARHRPALRLSGEPLETHRLLRPHRQPLPWPGHHRHGLGSPPPRPWRGDLRRPARPRGARAGRLRSGPRADVRRCGKAAQRVRRQRHGTRASAPRRHGQSQPRLGRDRGARARHRDPQPVAHPAVPARRREPLRDRASRESRAGPAPAADAEEPHAALSHGDGRAALPRRARLHRHRDADALQEHARRRARVPRPLAHPSRPVLRPAAVAAAVQADADDGGLRPLLPDREVLPRRGPARGSPARVHADRHRDLVPRGAGDPRHHGRPRARDVPRGARRRAPGSVPDHEVRGCDARLRLGQARPARPAEAHRAHRSDEDGRLQGLPRCGGLAEWARGRAQRAGRRHALAQGDRRLLRVRRHLRREGSRLHQGERRLEAERGRPAIARREVPVARRAGARYCGARTRRAATSSSSARTARRS